MIKKIIFVGIYCCFPYIVAQEIGTIEELFHRIMLGDIIQIEYKNFTVKNLEKQYQAICWFNRSDINLAGSFRTKPEELLEILLGFPLFEKTYTQELENSSITINDHITCSLTRTNEQTKAWKLTVNMRKD